MPKDMMTMSDADRSQMALTICEEIEASEAAKGSLPERWKRNEEIYKVIAGTRGVRLGEGMESYEMPLVTPRIDRVVGTIHSSITGISPTVQCLDEVTGEAQDALERTLDAVADDGDFAAKFKLSARNAALMNLGILRARPLNGRKTMKLENIPPQRMICYPAENVTFAEAKTVGHFFWEMRRRIEDKQDAGEYYPNPVVSEDSQQDRRHFPRVLTQPTQAVEQGDEQVRLAELVRECPKAWNAKNRYCLCVVSVDDLRLLSCTPYPYSKPWYFDQRLDEAEGNVWPDTSVAQKMQGLQNAFSDIHTILVHGSTMAAFPIVVITKGSIETKVMKYGPCTMLEADEGFQAQVLPTGFDPKVLPLEIDKIEQMADGLSGISQLGISQRLPSGTSAHEAQALVNATDERKDQYTEAISPSVQSLWEFFLECLTLHFEEFRMRLGSRFPQELTYADVAQRNYQLTVTGRTGNASPQTLIQKMQALLQLAAMPGSQIDPIKVQAYMLDLLELPRPASYFLKDPNLPAIAQQIGQMLMMVQQGQIPIEQAVQAIMQEVNGGQTNAGGTGPVLPQPGMDGMAPPPPGGPAAIPSPPA